MRDRLAIAIAEIRDGRGPSRTGITQLLQDADNEIGRLRTILRVNILRLSPGTSHEEIDNLLDQ